MQSYRRKRTKTHQLVKISNKATHFLLPKNTKHKKTNKKSKLRFQAGSPAERRFLPNALRLCQSRSTASAAPARGPGQEGARGPAPRRSGGGGAGPRGRGLARLPRSETRPSAPRPPNLAAGEAAEFRKLFQKNKIPTLTLLN